MCQYSELCKDDTSSVMKGAPTSATEMSPKPPSAFSSSPTICNNPSVTLPTLTDLGTLEACALRQWRDTLFAAAQRFNAHSPAFTFHLKFLQIRRGRMHHLTRRCSQARLYPNPASSNSKTALRVLLTTLITDMDVATKLHDVYSAALLFQASPVHAVVNDLKVSDVRCCCIECTAKNEQWVLNTRVEIRTEADGLLASIKKMSTAFRKLEAGMLRLWKKGKMEELKNMIYALPEQKDLEEMAVVKKYFPRQVKEMREIDNSHNVAAAHGADIDVGKVDEGEKYDSGCEISP